MKKIYLIFCVLVGVSTYSFAQKKVLDHSDIALWSTLENETVAPNGSYLMYSLEKGEKDQYLKLKDKSGKLLMEQDRGENGKFTYDSQFAIFELVAWQDSVMEMKRRKVKKKDLPKDTLAVYNIADRELIKIPAIKSYKMPEKWAGYLAFQQEELPEAKPVEEEEEKEKSEESSEEKGEETTEKKSAKKAKKQNKENGYHLVVHNLATAQQDTFQYVLDYAFAKEGKKLAFTSSGVDSVFSPGVYFYDVESASLTPVFEGEGEFKALTLSESGDNLAFMANLDTTEMQVKPFGVYQWSEGEEKAEEVVAHKEEALPTDYIVSENAKLQFSKDETKLFFGTTTQPILQDTSILDEEIVNVEVWTYDEPRLYTVQEIQAERDKKKYYHSVVHLDKDNKIVNLASQAMPETELGNEGNAPYAIVYTEIPYFLQSQWEGYPRARDVYVVDLATGEKTLALKRMRGFASFSPMAKYIYGYDVVDSTWIAYNVASKKTTKLTDRKVFYREIHDTPNHPYAYGAMGWLADDEAVLLYDRYDIWKFDPENPNAGERLTQGREKKTVYRYLKLDSEERFIDPKAEVLLSSFNETDKSEGYQNFNMKNGKMSTLLEGNFALSRPRKAELAEQVMFTQQTFEQFPDILTAELSFKNPVKISDANPQQGEYNWGTIELIEWQSLDGETLEGMLVKPENFDPNKKYPMIVNFYEKSSDRLHGHRAPYRGRSTINYSFYTSRGYVIFNPNVNYREGYPGESAYNCVIPGVTYLINQGFVDADNIGVQGHSWGGYQIAYLVTKTDIFKCAEAGAPVPNMISAYGGIRWWTGLSRQFQYEHTQSRIGGTPWQYPLRYIENSPIFYVDKINTPLLIMHNDADGHVPWYQGIEFFVSLRRLGKPSWFLNYNGEPHWPLKKQNRADFNVRMQQFFDYYLKDAPMPVWMDKGVPAIQKGIQQNLELMESDEE